MGRVSIPPPPPKKQNKKQKKKSLKPKQVDGEQVHTVVNFLWAHDPKPAKQTCMPALSSELPPFPILMKVIVPV